jgi:hypothetical protein
MITYKTVSQVSCTLIAIPSKKPSIQSAKRKTYGSIFDGFTSFSSL